MPKSKNKKVKAWVRLGTTRYVDEIELPEDCFDDQGQIIEADAAEFVEIWINETLKLEYGASHL